MKTWQEVLILFVAIVLWFTAKAILIDAISPPSHNSKGGYIPACGDKPGIIGDDC